MISPKSLLSPFVPEQFKPLLSCVSSSAFRVIEWKKILADAPTLARRLATAEGVQELALSLKPHLPHAVEIDTSGEKPKKDTKLKLPSESGESILKLYFAQFKNESGLFLDLRPGGFKIDPVGQITWNPNGLWKKWDLNFRRGMLSVYSGYYYSKPELLRRGLLEIGLIKEGFSLDLIHEVEAMVLKHIGGDLLNQEFKISHFTESFEKLFQFLIKQKIILPPDFLYLGIYLASLYMHLEELGGSYNVREAFTSTFTPTEFDSPKVG